MLLVSSNGAWAKSAGLTAPPLYQGTRRQAPGFDLTTLQRLGTVLWQSDVEWTPQSSLTVGLDTIIVAGGRGGLSAFDLKTGSLKWQRDPRLLISWLAANGKTLSVQYSRKWLVRLLDGSTGTERWRRDLQAKIHGEMVLAEGVMILSLGPANDGIPVARRIVGLSLATGEQLWEWSMGKMECVTPVRCQQLVVFKSSDGNLYGIDAKTGQRQWFFDCLDPALESPVVIDGTVRWSGKRRRYVLDGKTGRLLETLALPPRLAAVLEGPDGVIHVSARDGYLYGVDGKTKKRKWRRAMRFHRSDILSAPMRVLDAIVVQWSGQQVGLTRELQRDERRRSGAWRGVYRGDAKQGGGRLYCLEADNGHERWMALTSPLVPGTERVYGQYFSFLGRDGKQHLFDTKTGIERWSWPVEIDSGSLPLTTIVDGVAYVVDGRGLLHAVRM